MTAFVPRHFPRHRMPSGKVLTDSQQHQYDVLRTVGGKLVSNKSGWWRVHSETHREKITGLNVTAMFKLVQMGLVVCGSDRPHSSGFLFMLPEIAKHVPGPRYERVNQIDKELPAATAAPHVECRACNDEGVLAIDSDLRDETPPNERVTRDSRVCTYCGGKSRAMEAP